MALRILDGHGRKVFVSNVGSQVTQGGSADFGAFLADRYSRFVGYISIPTTGATYRIRTGASSGTWDISSSTTVGSGTTTIDALNYGRHVDLSITSVGTQTAYSFFLAGEPLR